MIGGSIGSWKFSWDDVDLRRIVREAYTKGKIVAAICVSLVVLVRAGCFKGRKATVFPHPLAVQELQAAGAKYVDRSVVVAANVVTARDPQSAEEFAQTVARLLEWQTK
ncbi:DJ-1/PfpI family protein [Thermodesulfitimonas autotrophica]|uniref:DJ-1/PfpI family protein n=1 Tax=Thermodesulfitimonas autotrophica TaxID=1894989 RepID=UPI000F50653F|nr:DJ-1/PfpI family protein [Thermodesulfitimonas autotrophica]